MRNLAKTCNETRIRFGSNRARDFSSRVELGFLTKEIRKEQRKKRKLDSTRKIQLDSTRLEKYFVQLDSTRLVQVFEI
jgi:hypothetical protein